MLNERDYSITEIVKQDEELHFVKMTDSIAFIRLYKRAYDDFKTKLYSRVVKFIKSAINFRQNDLLCEYLLNNSIKLMAKRATVS
jgi:hypothetical protein